MSLNLQRAYTSGNEKANTVDITELFDAFRGLEDRTKSLAGLTLQPATDGTIFEIKNSAGTVTLSYNSSKGELYIGGDIDDL